MSQRFCVHGFRFSGAADRPRPGSACERPAQLVCVRCPTVVVVDCHSTRTKTCEPCGFKYRERVRRVARVHHDDLLLVTLTAPGSPGHMRQTRDGEWIRCPCGFNTTGTDELALWNSTAGQRWNRLLEHGVKRRDALRAVFVLDGEHGPTVTYFKAAEAQRRGALHFHVLVRVRPGTVVTPELVELLGAEAERQGFGHILDVQAVQSHRAAGYVAKYVSKGSNDRPDVPWSKDDPQLGRVRARTATYRTWSASRSWPHTMRGLRQAQHHYAAVLALLPSWEDRSIPAAVARPEDVPPRPDLPV